MSLSLKKKRVQRDAGAKIENHVPVKRTCHAMFIIFQILTPESVLYICDCLASQMLKKKKKNQNLTSTCKEKNRNLGIGGNIIT